MHDDDILINEINFNMHFVKNLEAQGWIKPRKFGDLTEHHNGGDLSCDGLCIKDKFYFVFEPFHTSRCSVRNPNHMTKSNFSESRFCSKLIF